MLKKLQDFLLDYSIVVFLTIFVNIILRIGEYWYINSVKLEAIPFSVLYSRSINYDTLFIVLFSLVGLIPFGVLAFVQLNFTKFLVRFVFLFLQLSWLLLTGYFLINNALLSSAVFEFSLMEIVNIIFSEFSMNRITLLFSGGIILLIFFFLLIKSKKWKHDRSAYWIIGTYVFISIVSVVNRKHTFKPITFFENYNHFLVGNSKPVFLIKTYSENLNFDLLESREEIKKEVLKLNSLYADKHFLSTDFPLMNDSEYQNVLQSYFAECNEKPNIVIIVSESLSASFSGSNCATKKSLTPFVDSIIANGLSWTNFFSNAERSYGVLPNLLASLPSGIGARGFINMKQDTLNKLRFPKHNSLIQILRDNDYYTSYFYGGSGNFDNVSAFIQQNKVDNCFTMDQFDTLKYPMNLYVRSQQAWGHKDAAMYNQGLDVMDSIRAPYLSVFQTLSNHSPYNLSDEIYYTDDYLQSRLHALNLTLDDVQKIDKAILSSICYADDALKHFFERIKQRDDFKNTIFLITGDHAVDLNLADNIFENYHVPFVIYSPLLRKTAKFKGVCSHIDVLPSLLALLKHNYQLEVPQKNHWLGNGLSTSLNFEANRVIPLNIKAIDMPSFIIHDKVFFGSNIYQFKEDLKITPLKDSIAIDQLNDQLETYKKINNYVCVKNLIDQ